MDWEFVELKDLSIKGDILNIFELLLEKLEVKLARDKESERLFLWTPGDDE